MFFRTFDCERCSLPPEVEKLISQCNNDRRLQRIYHGTKIEISQAAHMAAILQDKEYYCVGGIISNLHSRVSFWKASVFVFTINKITIQTITN